MSELRSAELAPSEERTDEPGFTQIVGLAGAGFAVLGIIVIAFSQSSPRMIPVSWAYMMTAAGLLAMFYHALRDGSLEIRRAYFWIGVALLAVMGVSIALAQFGGDRVPLVKSLAWAPLLGFLGLVFTTTALRHETDDWHVRLGLQALLIAGTVLSIGTVVLAVILPDTIVGPGVLYGLLGLGFVMAFLSRVDTGDGPGFLVASALGVLGGAALLYALGRAVFPTILYEGPPALKNAYQVLDPWKTLARGAIVLFCVGVAAWGGLNRNLPAWLRGGLALLGLGFAGVFVAASVNTFALPSPKPFLVPHGLLLGGLGLVYLAFSLGLVSDSPLIAMTRRELASYFYSPIAYVVLLGMAVIEFIGYWLFLGVILRAGPTGPRPFPEPVLQAFVPGTFLGPIAVVFLIPALTMRLFSEERRSGTMEVLITAPVSEWTIVLSKFLGSWFFYMLTWLPMGLYLLGLRFEGGQAFDYRPLLGLYIAIGVCGMGFVAMGLFFSSLTKNQIIAAVLTFMAMLLMLSLYWYTYFTRVGEGAIRELLNALSIASYWSTWEQAASGQLMVRDLVLHGSLAVFWLFLTVKSLESRKWG
ncbi:ABC transporter permease [Limnoglobus roseus]|uniref:ABC-2 type transporter n=1 Tax=Limnoglobus roseus TaxID=2598579 RepID=A0A5C1ABI1_9BACT|nr:ABC transporter permease [Limnoglobus roseus]QEL15523.1 ABC-2 type transporter [Limnoglobus roseus]